MSKLLIPMYHRVNLPGLSDPHALFSDHLDMLQNRYDIVLPGETLSSDRPSVCLTFDDAYLDFYEVVYPLLQEKGLKAVLGIPAGYIKDTPSFDNSMWPAPLCAWPMLKEMSESGCVVPASHSMTHLHLSKHLDDFQRECIDSKSLLEDKLSCKIDTFIYPYGDSSKQLRRRIRDVYPYDMRIGGASNLDWSSRDGLLYRIDAEHYWPKSTLFTNRCLTRFQRRFWWNRIRGK